jgi:HSP20 family protein
MTSLLMRPEPFSQELGRLFDALVSDMNGGSTRRWVPPMDLIEQDDVFVLRADLPGMSEEDVSIEFENGVLTISGERRLAHERTERGWHRLERSFGSFSRTLSLPDGIDPESIAATFDRGVLEVRVPKPEATKPRRIAIGANCNGRHALEGEATETTS